MGTTMNFLKGYLTYIVAGVTALWAVVGFFLGLLEPEVTGTLLLGALSVFGLRRALPR